jgi:acyl-CoA thioesterase I
MKIMILMAWLIILSPFSSPALATNATTTPPNYTIVILGDSLTDGYGLSKDEAFPALVEKRFHADGQKDVKVLNAGISGSTSSSAPQRLKWFLKTKPQLLAIALGANDGLRGLPTAKLYENLSQTIETAQAAKIKVVLFGMKMPANYGAKYQKDFEKVYVDLAKKYKVELLDFLLANVATLKDLNQEDGIHPNAKGHEVIANQVYPFLKKVIKR